MGWWRGSIYKSSRMKTWKHMVSVNRPIHCKSDIDCLKTRVIGGRGHDEAAIHKKI